MLMLMLLLLLMIRLKLMLMFCFCWYWHSTAESMPRGSSRSPAWWNTAASPPGTAASTRTCRSRWPRWKRWQPGWKRWQPGCKNDNQDEKEGHMKTLPMAQRTPEISSVSNGHCGALLLNPISFICFFLYLPKWAKKCTSHSGKHSDPPQMRNYPF